MGGYEGVAQRFKTLPNQAVRRLGWAMLAGAETCCILAKNTRLHPILVPLVHMRPSRGVCIQSSPYLPVHTGNGVPEALSAQQGAVVCVVMLPPAHGNVGQSHEQVSMQAVYLGPPTAAASLLRQQLYGCWLPQLLTILRTLPDALSLQPSLILTESLLSSACCQPLPGTHHSPRDTLSSERAARLAALIFLSRYLVHVMMPHLFSCFGMCCCCSSWQSWC